MNMQIIKIGAQNLGHKIVLTAQHHATGILVTCGIGGGFAAGIMACKATLKLPQTMGEIQEEMEVAKTACTEEEDPKQYRANVTKAYIYAGTEIAKLYGPAMLVAAASTASILYSKRVADKRLASSLNALSITERLFSEYRQRVVEAEGAEADRNYRYGIKEVIDEVPILDKNGVPKVDKKTGEVKTKSLKSKCIATAQGDDPWARMFEQGSSIEWEEDPQMNYVKLIQRQDYLNQRLRARGFLFMNDVYEALGYPATAAGQDYGYVYTTDCQDFIDFGLNKRATDDLNCEDTRLDLLDFGNNSILLTFEGAHYVKDKVWRAQRIFR